MYTLVIVHTAGHQYGDAAAVLASLGDHGLTAKTHT